MGLRSYNAQAFILIFVLAFLLWLDSEYSYWFNLCGTVVISVPLIVLGNIYLWATQISKNKGGQSEQTKENII